MNISTCYDSPLVAVVDSTSYERVEGRLTIYSLESGHVAGEFPVRFDYGGRRLALGRDGRSCFVGCFNKYGIAAYSTLNGAELWRRKDLREVQRIAAFPFEDVVFCGTDKGGYLLCAHTGQTLAKGRDVEHVYSSPLSRHALASAETLELHAPYGTKIGNIKRATFAELDACFSEGEVLVTESTGGRRCFDVTTLEVLWKHTPRKDYHFEKLCYNRALGCFVGTCFNYEGSEPDDGARLVRFDCRTGSALADTHLDSDTHEFCLAGGALFTSDLRLLSVETGEVLRSFAPPSQADGTAAS